MKTLVATTKTQGTRKNDFCFVPEGEPVTFGCECDREDIDGQCGCRRSMVGLTCRKGTTTMLVADTDMDRAAFIAALADSIKASGFGLTAEDFAPEADEIIRIADYFPVGTVLERRGETFRVRRAGKE
jgi:hypothetical protein